MRAFDIVIFILIFNLAFGGLTAMGIWSTTAPTGTELSGAETALEVESLFGIPGISITWTLIAILAAMFLGGVSTLFGKVTTPQVAGIIIFASIFEITFLIQVGILASVFVPAAMIAILGFIQQVALIVAIIQFATGVPLPQAE